MFQKENTPFSATEESLPDFRKIPRDQVDRCLWTSDLPVRPRAMLKSGDHLFMGVMPVGISQDDPHATYEGRKGGKIWIASAKDGRKVAEYKLGSPVVWESSVPLTAAARTQVVSLPSVPPGSGGKLCSSVRAAPSLSIPVPIFSTTRKPSMEAG